MINKIILCDQLYGGTEIQHGNSWQLSVYLKIEPNTWKLMSIRTEWGEIYER